MGAGSVFKNRDSSILDSRVRRGALASDGGAKATIGLAAERRELVLDTYRADVRSGPEGKAARQDTLRPRGFDIPVSWLYLIFIWRDCRAPWQTPDRLGR